MLHLLNHIRNSVLRDNVDFGRLGDRISGRRGQDVAVSLVGLHEEGSGDLEAVEDSISGLHDLHVG